MRLIPIIAAATIGLFATAAVAQNMNTADPNSAPGASATGGKPETPVGRRDQADGHLRSEQRPWRVRDRRQAEACLGRRGQEDGHQRSEQRLHQRAEHGQAQGQEKEDSM